MSARMAQIAAALARHPRRLVLFDSPPLLVSSEARALAHTPGAVFLVARSGKTPRQALLDALAQVDKQRVQGIILNESYAAATSQYGDYGYPGQQG
jgi:protein-tyrosine kinase